jgi:hypothetical protein
MIGFIDDQRAVYGVVSIDKGGGAINVKGSCVRKSNASGMNGSL